MRRWNAPRACALFSTFAGMLYVGGAAAQPPCADWAQLVSLQGVIEARRADSGEWRATRLNDYFCPGDTLRVQRHGRGALLLHGETIVRIDQHTTLTLLASREPGRRLLDLLSGVAHFISRVPRSLDVKTPYVNAAIEGTEFLLQISGHQVLLAVYEGVVHASNDAGEARVASGETITAAPGRAPAPYALVRPRDAVQWALYYPPLVYYRPEQWADQPAMQSALAAERRGDVDTAVQTLAGTDDARVLTYRAALQLSVGRTDAARADLERALIRAPDDGDARALLSMMATASNDRERALQLAQDAVAAAPQSPTTLLALSYALQAGFDLDAAHSTAERAVRDNPKNALAWTRLAELRLSLGETDQALAAATEAAALDPSLSRTQTLLGFIFLMQAKSDEAKLAFDKAIGLDSADPLARLGLGLAHIRQGALDTGRRDIEIAASLDPSHSLIRSYLGKAYHEEKREGLATSQLSLAKELDRRDPTPWFYHALLKQSQNRPIEAFHDIHTSIDLNDNRAVYRSRLMLDQDIAARNASLGRVYGDLSFEHLGATEAYRSIATDPGNYSAHQLLADLYTGRQRHEVARVSERLQAQLLQPLSTKPVRPLVNESNPLFPAYSGPWSLSDAESDRLFVGNGVAFLGSAIAASNDTSGHDFTLSAVHNSLALSAGQTHYQTDGFRPNNDLTQTLNNFFAQIAISPDLSIQAEYRDRKLKHGDLDYNFELTLFDPDFRRDLESTVRRAGINYSFSRRSRIIASTMWENETEVQSFSFGDQILDQKSATTELQHLYTGPTWQLVSGVGRAKVNGNIDAGFAFTALDVEHRNTYLYSLYAPVADLRLTLGTSVDSLDDNVIGDIDKTNPKLGLVWDMTDSTTVRMAAFRTLKRTLVADQTIEPTQVAGFNQFFDDQPGTSAVRTGAGIDHRFSRSYFAGIEVSKRKLEVPTLDFFGQATIEEWTERLYRAYANWIANPRVAFSAAYEREDFERNEPPLFFPPDTRTTFVPLTVSYHNPSGFLGRARTTFVSQEVIESGVAGEDTFTLIDLMLGYRLPGRRGTMSVQVQNVTDESFRYQALGFRKAQEESPLFFPERTVSVTLSLAW